MSVKINVTGLKEFRKELKAVGPKFPKELQKTNKRAAGIVVPEAKRRAGQSRRNLAGGLRGSGLVVSHRFAR